MVGCGRGGSVVDGHNLRGGQQISQKSLNSIVFLGRDALIILGGKINGVPIKVQNKPREKIKRTSETKLKLERLS